MSDKKHELYLIAAALVIAAVLILYNTFSFPSQYIASTPQSISESSVPQGTAINSSGVVTVNINTASIDELMTLDGIGKAKAEQIIEYREENGLFRTVDELLNVSGIGVELLESMRPYVTV